MLTAERKPKIEADRRGRRISGEKLRIIKYPTGIKARKFKAVSMIVETVKT
jgi:hypothetical protein